MYRRLFPLYRLFLVPSIPALAFTACSADVDPDTDDVDWTEDALTQTVTARADGQFDIVCRSSNGIEWSRVVTAAERASGRLCSGIPYEMSPTWTEPRDGYRFVYDKPDIQIARFSVSTEGTYRISIPIYREWLGASDHPEAGNPAKLVVFVDGTCAGSALASSTSADHPNRSTVTIQLAPGPHQIGIAIANDYWDQAQGFDRNLWAAPVKLARTRATPTATPTDTCTIRGEYPGAQPVASERTQSVLKNNSSPLAREFTAALEMLVDFRNGRFRFYKMLVHGFNLGERTHAAFANETRHFNVTPQTEVSRASLEGLVASWQPKLDELRARIEIEHDNGLITTQAYSEKIATLKGLQNVIDGPIQSLRTTFDRYPEVSSIKLDLR